MITNRNLLLPYVVPYFAYVVIASTIGRQVSDEADYILRIFLCSIFLLWGRKWYSSFTGPKSLSGSCLTGVAAGLFGTILWIVLLLPFAPGPGEVESWQPSAVLLRLLSATLLVPLLEEIVMRRYIFNLAYQWSGLRSAGEEHALHKVMDEASVNSVEPGLWNWPAVLISTAVFVSGHQVYEWPASVAYGLLMALDLYHP